MSQLPLCVNFVEVKVTVEALTFEIRRFCELGSTPPAGATNTRREALNTGADLTLAASTFNTTDDTCGEFGALGAEIVIRP